MVCPKSREPNKCIGKCALFRVSARANILKFLSSVLFTNWHKPFKWGSLLLNIVRKDKNKIFVNFIYSFANKSCFLLREVIVWMKTCQLPTHPVFEFKEAKLFNWLVATAFIRIWARNLLRTRRTLYAIGHHNSTYVFHLQVDTCMNMFLLFEQCATQRCESSLHGAVTLDEI